MTTGIHDDLPAPAPQRLIIGNLQFERCKDKDVKVLSSGGKLLCSIHKEDWYRVGSFFESIASPGARL